MSTRDEQVAEFEQKIGRELPPDYRKLLLSGPFPVWTDESRPESEALYILYSLYDLKQDLWESGHGGLAAAWDDAAWYKREGLLKDWLLEVGEIYDGVRIGIKLHGDQAGSVWTYTADDGEAKFYANSLQKLLDGLHADGASFGGELETN